MFELKSVVSRNSPTEMEDSKNVKFALTALDYYDDDEAGFSPYGDRKLFNAIQSFQKENDLKVDGVIKPDGPTHGKMKEGLRKNPKSGSAFEDFKRNFNLMNESNTHGADKYFHCIANYEASSRGWIGRIASKILSDGKELKDRYHRRYGSDDIEADQKANQHGRTAAQSGKYGSAKEACAIFRPSGLDEKY